MKDIVPGTQAISRALSVLRLVALSQQQGLYLGEVSEFLSLSKPTVHRLLTVLVSEGLVEQDSQTSKYFVGPECYALGRCAADRFGIVSAAHDSVVRIAHECGDSAFFSIRSDIYALCVQREDGSYPLKTHVLQPGSRHLLGAGAGSMAILSMLSDEYVEGYLHQYGPLLERNYENMSVDRLRQQIMQAGSKGFSVNEGMVVPGSWGVGVAVRMPNGDVGGAISIAAVESRLPKSRQQELGEQLMIIARQLEAYLLERETL